MSSYVYTNARRALLAGELDLANDRLDVILCMTNTTADEDEDADTVGDITTLDEFDGDGYARQTLGSQAVTAVDADDRGMFDAGDAEFGALGEGTRQIAGALLVKYVDGGNGDIPIAWYDDGGFPLSSGDITIQWSASGLIRV